MRRALWVVLVAAALMGCSSDGGSTGGAPDVTPTDTGSEDAAAPDAPADVPTPGPETEVAGGEDVSTDEGPDPDSGCVSLFAATLAASQGIECGEGLSESFHSCAAGTTPDACSAALWASPVSRAAEGELQLWWAPQCRDGGSGCQPEDPDAVVCVDGTRPYYYIAPGTDADGQPSRKWMFRWHNGQTMASQVAAGCAFEGSCGDPMGSQSTPAVADAISSGGLFRPDPPPGQDWLTRYNRVYFVDPCIADYYGGDAAYTDGQWTAPGGKTYAYPYQFRGRNFLEGVFAQLSSLGGDDRPQGLADLADAELVILYAWSGGGRHIIQNIDRLSWDADGDHQPDGGFMASLAPSATVRGVVSSRFQPGIEVQRLFAQLAESAGEPDVDGAFTGHSVTAAHAEAAGVSVYDLADEMDHSTVIEVPAPRQGGICPAGPAPDYPPFQTDTCWGDAPLVSNESFREGGLFYQMLGGWNYTVDASCLAAHADDPETCYDFQHVLLNHVVSDVFVYIAQHDQAYRSPKKLPTYPEDDAYYWAPSHQRQRVVKQLADFARYRFTDSELATGADPSCASGGCTDHGAAVFAPDLWLHDDPVNSSEAGFRLHLCRDGAAVSLSDALRTWAERTTTAAEQVWIEGVEGVTRCEDGADVDGDGFEGCQDPELKYALKAGSDTEPACP